ncbi:hypothetical protein FA95DRAFT_1651509 [Auriscalpium vulgare]|uniref:Uncharacterized protein n=1 Tax=Auriscalpium vulgare TaxID=40419 RepID=A0ACB8SB95_9AGAM|nr:hypothetical protein FA95DRAFT_1651509 [Auriscalpium vulgare]
MSDVVIREVTKDVWTFSKPFSRLGFLRIGGRSTAIKLKTGDVWVLASTPLTPETKTTIDSLGPVKYIVGADSVHHLYLGEFHKAYPEARLVAVEEAVQKKNHEKLNWHGWWGDKNQEPTFGFEDEIKHVYFSGFKNKDVAFLHTESKTLIVADLLFNLPAIEQYKNSWFGSGVPGLNLLFGNASPYTGIHQMMTKSLGVGPDAMRRDAKAVAEWDFTRVIPCHGDVIESDGNKAWRSAFSHWLN